MSVIDVDDLEWPLTNIFI